MSLIRRCDRCGKELMTADEYVEVEVNYRDTCGPRSMDLCNACGTNLRLFLNKNWPLTPTNKG